MRAREEERDREWRGVEGGGDGAEKERNLVKFSESLTCCTKQFPF